MVTESFLLSATWALFVLLGLPNGRPKEESPLFNRVLSIALYVLSLFYQPFSKTSMNGRVLCFENGGRHFRQVFLEFRKGTREREGKWSFVRAE